MTNWLSVYAYRITLNWAMFVLPVLLILFIAVITISSQIVKAALSNPSESLRHE
jgi:putative ABC transport system permease protein